MKLQLAQINSEI